MLSFIPARAEAPVVEKRVPTNPKELIVHFADMYGANEDELLVVAFCESGYKPHAVGDGGRARNIFQFHKPTFDRYARLMGEELSYDSAHDQAKLAAWIFKHYPKERRAWTCWTKNFS